MPADSVGFVPSRLRANIAGLEARPGVYEFAVSKNTGRRCKVYVGESGSILKRHQRYARTGDHLVLLLDAAIRDGCTVWMRCKYTGSKESAVAWEAYFLRKYDYAWNMRHNACKRNVSIVKRWNAWLCMFSMHVVDNPVKPELL